MAEVAEVAEVKCCSNPGCDQPGTKSCSACKITVYCCATCQTADWTDHKEECDGHLRKLGTAHIAKAKGFHDEKNWVQTVRYAELAATKLKKLKDRRLETVKHIDEALTLKFSALQFMAHHSKALECVEENYTLWAMNHLRNPNSIRVALLLIQSCLHNYQIEDAHNYARHAMFMINDMTDSFIPSDERPAFLAEASYWLARSIFALAQAGGIPPAEQQKAGEEATTFIRQALELHTQYLGDQSAQVAADMVIIADILDYFNDVDDDEILRLYEQSIAISSRLNGSLSVNVAVGKNNLGSAYKNRAVRAKGANDLDRCIANLELALPHYREAVRIYRALNHVDGANQTLGEIAQVEEGIRRYKIDRAAATKR